MISRFAALSSSCLVLAVGALAALGVHAPATRQQKPFVEHVEVTRVLIDARVLDAAGRAIPGLGPSDFVVRIGGRPARVESAEWVETAGTAAAARAWPAMLDRGADVAGADATPGRLVVFLVQRDLERLRIAGLMRLGQMVDAMMQPLTEGDRIAVLSFDTRLRYWTDFTNDVARVRTLLSRDVIAGSPRPINASADVSLLSRLPLDAAARVNAIESALLRLAEALEPLPGAKSLILLGYGFGRFDFRSGSVTLMDGFAEASAALQRARVTVSSLNVTQANYNSLQAGLETVAGDTGGVYASTYEFPESALARVSELLAGYYVLFVEKPELRSGPHRIDVRLAGRRGTVMSRRSYVEVAARARAR